MLIETLKTLDKQKIIKLISIDYLKSNQIIFDHRITHVPAILLPDVNKILFGKDVFDHLLLPGKGVLLNPNITSNTSNTSNTSEITDLSEPSGIDSFISQSYENIDDTDNYLTGPVTIWEKLDGKTEEIQINTKPIGNTDTEKSHKQLPSLAEIQKMRESALH
tara:strand:- start:2654 stop:3142 length:489 start_codon:yes stop_codon:yes gene_type:complete